ncbi:MAG: NifU family protein [Acidimicrobiales bacterium]
MTEAALAQVLDILAGEDHPELLGLRIAVTGTRGVEYAYDLSFEELTEAADDDLLYDQGDLKVMVPADSVDPLWGHARPSSTAGQGGLVIRNPNRPDPLSAADVELSGTVAERVAQLLEQSINPALAAHGGFAGLVEVIDGPEARVPRRQGRDHHGRGCQGCAVSVVTLRDGIQSSILQHVPEVVEVIDSTDHDAGTNPSTPDPRVLHLTFEVRSIVRAWRQRSTEAHPIGARLTPGG